MRKDTILKILSALGIDDKSQLSEEVYQEEVQHIEGALTRIESVKKSRVLYKVFDMEEPAHKVFLEEKILIGKSIAEFLGHPKKIIICATTLGGQVDQLIRRESMLSISNTVLLDTTAMVLIEEVLDKWMESFSKEVKLQGLYLSNRFSPGYGDMPLHMQGDILQLLEAQKQIGLTVSDSNILLPKKSVTAIIGLYDQAVTSRYSNCDACLIRQTCEKRKKGDYCGY